MPLDPRAPFSYPRAVGFEDILKRRLGPMQDLVRRSPAPPSPSFDPAQLRYRRAVGLEVTLRPRESWTRFTFSDPSGRKTELRGAEARTLLSLSDWRTAAELGVSPKVAWSWVEQGLVYFSTETPTVTLSGRAGALRAATPLARRRSVLITPAVETPVEIAPMPFMPRGRDLLVATPVGARFASRERGEEVFALNLVGDQRLAASLARLLPGLDGRATGAELLGTSDEEARSLLELLDVCGFLEPLSEELRARRAALAQPSSAQVTWLGHAGVLVQTPRSSVLVDPVFFSESDPPEPFRSHVPFDERALPHIDAVLITHGDNDHLNPSSLALLPRDTLVFIPKGADPYPPFQVDMRGLLHALGFSRVRELEIWETVPVGELTVTACPFEGEDWGLPLAQLTYLLESEEASVFLSADSLRMPETYEWLAARPRRVDLAFLGVSGSAESHAMPAAFGYGNFYQDFVAPVQHQQWVQHCAGPEEAAENAALFRPRAAFGYAAGGASFIRTAYSDRGDHARFAEALGRQAPGVRAVALPLGEPTPVRSLVEG